MKNFLFYSIFCTLCLSFSCSPKVATTNDAKTETIPREKTEKIKTPDAEFKNFTYEIETNGSYVETVLDKTPSPLNGEKDFFMSMYRGMKYPKIARENGVAGTVTIRVVLNEFGQLESSEILKDIGAGCGAEALKAVKRGFESPIESAMLAGNRVKVRFNIPVHFRLH